MSLLLHQCAYPRETVADMSLLDRIFEDSEEQTFNVDIPCRMKVFTRSRGYRLFIDDALIFSSLIKHSTYSNFDLFARLSLQPQLL